MKNLSIKKVLLLAFVLTAVLFIQFRSIQRPFLGHFSSYQTVSASMSRNMIKENFSELLLPKTDLMIGKKRSMPLNQYPFHSLAAAGGAVVFEGSLEFWGRFQAIFFNLLSLALVGLIAARIFNPLVGWTAFALGGLSPFSMIYGQMFMSESLALCCLLSSVYLLLSWRSCQAPTIWRVIGSGFFFSIAITSRIHFLLFLPVFFLYVLGGRRHERKHIGFSAIFALASLAMPLAWYVFTYFVSMQSDNIHTNLFLQLGGRKVGDQVFLKDLNYYRHVLDILTQKILPLLAFPFFIVGAWLLAVNKEGENRTEKWLLLGSCCAGLLIIFLFPQKIMVHEFYLYGLFPFMVILAAYGISKFFDAYPELKRSGVVVFLMVLCLLISGRYFLHPIFKYPAEDERSLLFADIVKQRTEPDDWLIMLGQGYSAFEYYVDRPSWSIDLGSAGKPLSFYLKDTRYSGNDPRHMAALERAMANPMDWLVYLKAQGARYLIVLNGDDLKSFPVLSEYIANHCKRMVSSGRSHLYDLEAAQ
jgi:hypothetical protein